MLIFFTLASKLISLGKKKNKLICSQVGLSGMPIMWKKIAFGDKKIYHNSQGEEED